MNYDRHNLYKIIEDFPKQFEDTLIFGKDFKLNFKGLKKAMVVGMGGSAFPGDLIHNFLKGVLNISVFRGYHIPSYVTKDTLIIISSYSGNTEETLSALADAISKKFKIVIITAGGKLMEQAQKKKLPLFKIPAGLPPRFATGYFFTGMMIILERAGLTKKYTIPIFKLGEFLRSLKIEDEAKKIANKIHGKLPIIYSSQHFESIAKIWKIKFNENSKQQAFFNTFPELNHNEMIGWTKLITKPFFIFLRHRQDYIKIQKRMDILREILREKKLEVIEIWMDGRNILEQMFFTIYLGDLVSYHVALLNKVDPLPVDLVEEFKKRLEELF